MTQMRTSCHRTYWGSNSGHLRFRKLFYYFTSTLIGFISVWSKALYFDSFNYLLLSQDNCLLCSFLKKNLSETGYKEDGIRKIILQIRMKRKAFKLNAYTINPFILS